MPVVCFPPLQGICVDDRVTRFGSILASNFTGLQAILEMVKFTQPKVVTPESSVMIL
ncbi:unnamed protein product [Hydatigera taeniaeformis]|uniref:WS_DGAT_C domain-containing protein n=1 Tax=Hydatigena taeniaeformis TaxID=6205 RepID=A0A0R3WTI6_HYDTA|nr:unnamed protein product [Hydatigera taeniaeformis]